MDARVGKLYRECSDLSLWKRSNETKTGYAATRERPYARRLLDDTFSSSALMISDRGPVLRLRLLSQGYKKASSFMMKSWVSQYILLSAREEKKLTLIY